GRRRVRLGSGGRRGRRVGGDALRR
ncbi:MAG: hypothetical protein AVDCRST_MAG79-1390, partial [uncultured Thermoleophilia bacterium]